MQHTHYSLWEFSEDLCFVRVSSEVVGLRAIFGTLRDTGLGDWGWQFNFCFNLTLKAGPLIGLDDLLNFSLDLGVVKLRVVADDFEFFAEFETLEVVALDTIDVLEAWELSHDATSIASSLGQEDSAWLASKERK